MYLLTMRYHYLASVIPCPLCAPPARHWPVRRASQGFIEPDAELQVVAGVDDAVAVEIKVSFVSSKKLLNAPRKTRLSPVLTMAWKSCRTFRRSASSERCCREEALKRGRPAGGHVDAGAALGWTLAR